MSESTRALTVMYERLNNNALRDKLYEIREEISREHDTFVFDVRMMTLQTERLFNEPATYRVSHQ